MSRKARTKQSSRPLPPQDPAPEEETKKPLSPAESVSPEPAAKTGEKQQAHSDGEVASRTEPLPPQSKGRKLRRERRSPVQFPVSLAVLFFAVAVVVAILSSWYFYDWGFQSGLLGGVQQAKNEATRGNVPWPPEVAAELDKAMLELRDDRAEVALPRLQKLESETHPISSVTYLVALAALQNGDPYLAEFKANESIEKQERISDSLALLAVLASQSASDPERAKIAVPRVRAEQLLRQACLADGANPYPRYELGTLLRYQGRREEALALIQGAQARLNPIDSHMIMGITLELMKIEELPTEKLPAVNPDSDDVRKLFPAAYSAMRRGDFPQAALLLKKCREILPPDVFGYIILDPAMRKFTYEPELKAFFGN